MRKMFLFIAAVMCAASLTLNVQAKVLTFDFEGENSKIPAEWVNDETYPWTVVNNAPEGFGGEYCIKSGNSGVGSSSSTLEATFTFIDDGSISFDAGCWGEGTSTPWDSCCFYIDDVLLFHLGAVQSWEHWSFTITAGTHTFRWIYWKDSSVNPTVDAFFVDNIVVDLGVAPPSVEDGGWVHYTNWEYGGNTGMGAPGLYSWGMKIPGGTVTDNYLTEVGIYVSTAFHGDATLSIYQAGTTPADAFLMHEQEVTLSGSSEFQEISLEPSVWIDPREDTWIVFSADWQAMSYSMTPDKENGRWLVGPDGEWILVEDINPDYEGIAWMIRVLFESNPEVPVVIEESDVIDITSTSANVTWEGFAESFSVRYVALDPTMPATVILTENNLWGDGTGYQMLIDADADTYDRVFDIGRSEFVGYSSGGPLPNEVYNEFEYKIPENADGNLTAPNVVNSNSVSIDIPAGVYDWVITNPDPDLDRIFIVNSHGNAPRGADNWEFIGSMTYEFIPKVFNGMDGVDLTVTPTMGWIIENDVTSPYALTNLNPNTKYAVQVQANYGGGRPGVWSDIMYFTTLEEDTGIEEVLNQKSEIKNQKLMIDGQLFILRDGKIFNAQGARVK